MKIVLVNKYWYMRGGSERVVFATKKLLESAGHKVEIFGLKHPENIIENNYFIDHISYSGAKGLNKLRMACKSIYNKDAKNKFQKLLIDFKPDVVHFHNIYHQLSFSLLDVVRQRNIPSVMTLHDYKMISPNYNMFHHGKIDETCCGKKYYKCILNNCMENMGESIVATLEACMRKWKKYSDVIDAYIAPSEFVREKHIAHGINKAHISTVANPVDEVDISSSEKDGGYVLFFGRLSAEKGLDVLLDASKQIPDILIKIVGTGPMESILKSRIRDEQLNNVELLGFKQDKDLDKLISHAQLVVAPSVWYEVLGLSILEAKLAGKVVVGSEIGAIPESLPSELLCKPSDSGDLAQKMQTWYGAPFEKINSLGKQFRKEVQEKHNPKKYLDEILSTYERISK